MVAYYFRAVTLVCRSNVLPFKWNMHLINSRFIRMWSWRYFTSRTSVLRPYFPRCPCFHSGAEPRGAAAGLAPGNLAVRWARRGILPLHHAFSLHRDSSFLTCRTTRDQFYVSYKTTQRLVLFFMFNFVMFWPTGRQSEIIEFISGLMHSMLIAKSHFTGSVASSGFSQAPTGWPSSSHRTQVFDLFFKTFIM